jgi:2-hydroxymuconate-semialdehyde hydrolase
MDLSTRSTAPGAGYRERLLAGLAVEERRLQAGGVSTAIIEAGAGPPLLLLHGGIECGGLVWAPVVSQLAERNHIVIPDLPGLGESQPLAEVDTGRFCDWLAEMIELTCEKEPALVAHSLGGSLAALFAARRPDLLRRLVIYAAPGIGPYRMPLGLRLAAIRFGLRPTERNAERFDRWAFFDFAGARSRAPEWIEAFSAYTRAQARLPHVKRTMRWLVRTGTRRIAETELRRIAIRTELIWGSDDRFVPPALGEGASARLGWPLRAVDEAGHVPHIERPAAFLSELAALDPATR